MTRTPSEGAEQMAADYFNGRFSTLAECLDTFAADAVRAERARWEKVAELARIAGWNV